MDDLKMVRTLLDTGGPAPDAVDRSKRKLHNRMIGKRSRRMTLKLGLATGITVAAAAAVAFAVIPGGSTGTPEVVDGHQVLLAAATAAENASEETSAYRYVKETGDDPRDTDVYEYWAHVDGQWWFRGAKTKGKVVEWGEDIISNEISLLNMTPAQLRALPSDPAALKAWLVHAFETTKFRTSAGQATVENPERSTFLSLVSLVSSQPSTPAVRGAAFRAIALYPDVKSLGAVPGGQGLELPENVRLVIDQDSGRVEYTRKSESGHTTRIETSWTDKLPG